MSSIPKPTGYTEDIKMQNIILTGLVSDLELWWLVGMKMILKTYNNLE